MKSIDKLAPCLVNKREQSARDSSIFIGLGFCCGLDLKLFNNKFLLNRFQHRKLACKRAHFLIMTDVRSLLKNERATRRIDHPQASYTVTGTLECSVCKLPIKSDIDVWNKHIKSTQHAMRAERLRVSTKQSAAPPTQSVPATANKEPSKESKKRKANDDEDNADSRKRTRPEDLDPGRLTKRKVSFDEPLDMDIKSPTKPTEVSRPSPAKVIPPPPPPASTEPVDEHEWSAFEASLARQSSASPPPTTAPTTALTAAASITAAPLTAAELAAQSREETSLQNKERREAEVEAEKEDAARQLEEEFDEMEELEARVRRLKEQREKLRLKRAEGAEQKELQGSEERELVREDTANGVVAAVVEDEESEDDEDLDAWGGWGRT